MSRNLIDDLVKFGVFRNRIFSILDEQIGDAWMGKGYEGILQITFPSRTDETNKSGSYTMSLDSCAIVAKNNVWSGSTLSEAIDKANKDIDLWYEKNTNQQSNIPNSSRD